MSDHVRTGVMLPRLSDEKLQEFVEHKIRLQKIEDTAPHCRDCEHYGTPVMVAHNKRRNKRRPELMLEYYECDIHDGVLNTKYSIACNDFKEV